MGEIKNLVASKDFKNVILTYFEKISLPKDDLAFTMQSVEKAIDSFEASSKMVIYSTFLDSIDENLYKIGVQSLSNLLDGLDEESFSLLLKNFRYLPNENKKLSLSLILQHSHLISCSNDVIDKLYNEYESLNDVYLDNDIRVALHRYIRFRSYRDEGNPIKAEIIKNLQSGSCDYEIVVKRHLSFLNSFTVCDTWLNLSIQEKDPLQQCMSFLAAVKLANKNVPFSSYIEGLCFNHDVELIESVVEALVTSFKKAFSSAFPVDKLYEFYNYPDAAIPFVRLALKSPDVLCFSEISHTSVNMRYIFNSMNDVVIPQNWSSLEFIKLLIELHKHKPDEILSIFKLTMPNYVDVAFVGVLQLSGQRFTRNKKKILVEFISFYISCEKSSTEVLKYAWNMNKNNDDIKNLIIQAMQEYFTNANESIDYKVSRILDVAQNLKAVGQLLNCESLGFVVEIAVLAKKRNYVQLDRWMSEKLLQYNETFITAILSFIRQHYPILFTNGKSSVAEIVNVRENFETLDDMISFLFNNKSILSGDATKFIERVWSNYRTVVETPVTQKVVEDKDKMENAANCVTYLLQCLNGVTTYSDKVNQIDDFIKEIINHNPDSNKSEALYYVTATVTNTSYYEYLTNLDLSSLACMIGRMLLYGCIDQNRVLELTDTLLSNYPALSRYFFMAVSILSNSLPMLINAQPYCTKWFKSSFFSHFPPFIRFSIEYIHYKNTVPLNQDGLTFFADPYENASKMSTFIVEMLKRVNSDNHFLNSRNELIIYNEREINEEPIPPRDEIVAAVPPNLVLIITSLSDENVIESTEGARQIVTPDNIDGFALYFVHEHASQNMNLHSVYHKFLKEFDDYDLYWKVREQTNRMITEILLRCDDNFHPHDRDSLYALGSWFGMITVGESKPLLLKEINLKMILVESNSKGQDYIARILPFIKNFMISIKNSPIFTCSNPWVLGVSSVLAEIHSRSDLRQTVRFEIETIARSYGVNLKCIYVSTYSSIPETITRVKNYFKWNELESNVLLFKLFIDERKYLVYDKLDVVNLNSLLDYLNLDTCPAEFRKCAEESLMNVVREVSIWIMDRVAKGVGAAVETVIQHDFSRDPDDNHLIYAAHTMSKSASVGYAGVLVKGTHFDEICGRLRSALDLSIKKELEAQKKVIEREQLNSIIYCIVQENIEAIASFITKSCSERSVQTVDKRLFTEYEARRLACLDKRPFIPTCHPVAPDSLPERLKSKVGVPGVQQMSVYHEYNRLIPGFAHDNNQLLEKQIVFNDTSDKTYLLDMSDSSKAIVFSILYQCCKKIHSIISSSDVFDTSIIQSVSKLLECLVQVVVTNDIKMIASLIQQTVNCYLESWYKFKGNDCHPLFLQLAESLHCMLTYLRDTSIFTKYLCSLITKAFIDSPSEVRNNIEAIFLLIRARLIHMKVFDVRLSYEIMAEKGSWNAEFATDLTRLLLVEESSQGIVTEFELSNTLASLTQMSSLQPSQQETQETVSPIPFSSESQSNGLLKPEEELKTLPDKCEANSNNDKNHKNIQAETVLREWVRMYYTKSEVDIDTNFKAYMLVLAHYGVLRDEKYLFAFFKACIEITVELSLQVTEIQALLRAYQIVDSYATLVILMAKYYGGDDSVLLACKMNFFNKILSFLASTLFHDNTFRPKLFRPLVYQRMLISLIFEISRPDYLLDDIRNHLISCILGFLHTINPEQYPAFAHSFLMIIAHRHLIPIVLGPNGSTKNYLFYKDLLCDFLRFLFPFLSVNSPYLPQSVFSLYEGFIRLLLVISHDFPNFLSEFYMDFSHLIPYNCIQLRNILLCAVPSQFSNQNDSSLYFNSPSVRFNPNIHISESIFTKLKDCLNRSFPDSAKAFDLSSYLIEGLDLEIAHKNIVLISSIIYYLGTSAITEISDMRKIIDLDTVASTIHYEIMFHSFKGLDKQNRFIFLSAVANNIRFPSTHTKYFSSIILLFYTNFNDEAIREQIARVLMERVVCVQPYPHGIVQLATRLYKAAEFKFSKLKCFASSNDATELLNTMCKNLNISKGLTK